MSALDVSPVERAYFCVVGTGYHYTATGGGVRHSRAFVALRQRSAASDRELVRWEVFADSVAQVPAGQGGLTDQQTAAVTSTVPAGMSSRGLFLRSDAPLPDGSHERAGFRWGDEVGLGLSRADYGSSWRVWETREEYEGALS